MIRYYLDNWKLGVHLLFRTYPFGVNNEWWCYYPSMFGLPFRKRWHLIRQFKGMRFRAEIGFVSKETFIKLFPNQAKKHYGSDD